VQCSLVKNTDFSIHINTYLYEKFPILSSLRQQDTNPSPRTFALDIYCWCCRACLLVCIFAQFHYSHIFCSHTQRVHIQSCLSVLFGVL